MLLGTAGLLAHSGCEREPRPWECPPAAVGELVVSEVRGDQSEPDTQGQWIELYNATDGDIDLAGLVLRFRKLDGSGDRRIVVRERGVVAPARGYAVLGRFAAGMEPPHIDYGFETDHPESLYDTAAVELWACGVLLERAIYRDLPSTGSLGFDGALEPDSVANDDETRWCVDPQAPGTPRARNAPCS